MKKNKITTVDVMKYLAMIFIIGNAMYIFCMFLTGDMSSVKDFVIKTATAILINVALLIWVSCCEWIERKHWNQKNQVNSFGDGNYNLLKCSSGYAMLPFLAILLDFLFGVMLWREYNRDAKALMEILQSEEIIFPIAFLVFCNCLSVFVILYYCCYKVNYTKHQIDMVHFLKRKSIPCGQIQKIEYCHLKKGNRQTLILMTREEKLVLRSERLSDGWEEFIAYIKTVAQKYDIKIAVKNEANIR